MIGLALALSATSIALQMLEERGDLQPLRPALLRDPAVPGPRDRPDPRPPAAARDGRRGGRGEGGVLQTARRRGDRDRGARGRGARRPLRPQPVLPAPRRERRARGDDGLGAPRRARHGAAHGEGRPLDGDGRLPRRRAPRRIELPPPARGRHRAVPRHPARAVLHERRHVDRRRVGRAELALRCSSRRSPRSRRRSRSSPSCSRDFGSPRGDALRGGAVSRRPASSPSCSCRSRPASAS